MIEAARSFAKTRLGTVSRTMAAQALRDAVGSLDELGDEPRWTHSAEGET